MHWLRPFCVEMMCSFFLPETCIHVRLTGDYWLTIGANMSVNGFPFLCVRSATDWRTVQSMPNLDPELCGRKWIDGNTTIYEYITQISQFPCEWQSNEVWLRQSSKNMFLKVTWLNLIRWLAFINSASCNFFNICSIVTKLSLVERLDI